MKTGILGGTFNPVHVEHVALAKAAVKELKLDRLIVVPDFLPPHKSVIPASAKDRLNMLELSFRDDGRIEISDFEIMREGKSYTYLTVEHFRSLDPEGELFFILGGDMLADFKTWRCPERILKACSIAAFGREDFPVDFDAEQRYFFDRWGCGFLRLSYVGKAVSSTRIRIYSSFGLPSRDVCPQVAEYIEKTGIYGGDRYAAFVKKTLTPERLRHTANVAVCALKKVKELHLDEGKTLIAATLHDCAKYLPAEKFPSYSLPPDVPPPVAHAFLGAYVARSVLGIDDEEIIDAIQYHTSGKPAMSQLGKLIFVADMIEEGRSYDGVDKLRALYETDFELCFRECLKEEVLHLLNKKSAIYRLTLDAYDYYIKDKKEG